MSGDQSQVYAGFWARVGAWVIDAILIGGICFGIGWGAIDYVSPLGSNGRYIGLAIGTLYFGILVSRIGGGRTLGMRALGLKVVRLDGRPLGLIAAIGRAVLLVLPYLLNGWFFDVSNPVVIQFLSVLAVTLVFGVTLAQVYLLLFNLPTRRLFHDLVFGSIVVRADTNAFTVPKHRAHTVVAFLIVLAAFGLSIALPSIIKAWMPSALAGTSADKRVQDAVKALPEVGEVSVLNNETTHYSDGRQTTYRTLIVVARIGKMPSDPNPLMAKIGAEAVKAYQFVPGQTLEVRIVSGFDLGFAKYNNFRSYPFSTDCRTADVDCVK